ncbi:alternative ribosome rescue aminoacyl-tRNA hydrolase ArfB [soil metagenome]
MAAIHITREIIFSTSRSGGKGGQHVNQVETMVEGRWNVNESQLVTTEQKQTIQQKLASKITAEAVLLVKSQTERTQLGNKALVIKKMNSLVEQALIKKKARIATKVSKAVKAKTLDDKKQKASIKEHRRKIKPGDY